MQLLYFKNLKILFKLAGAMPCILLSLATDAKENNIYSNFTATGNYLSGQHAQFHRKNSKAADFLLAALKVSPENIDLISRTFLLLLTEGRFDEAIKFNKILEAKKSKTDLTNLLSLVNFLRNRNYKEARKKLSHFSEKSAFYIATPILKAWILQGLNESEKAIEVLAKFEKKFPSNTLYSMHKGLIYSVSGQNHAALKIFEKLLKREAGSNFRLIQLMGNIYEIVNETDKARALYERIFYETKNRNLLNDSVKRFKENIKPKLLIAGAADGVAEGLFGIANSLSRQQANEAAIILGQFALYLKPNYPIMQVLVGDLLELDNRLSDANEIYTNIDRTSLFWRDIELRIASNYHYMGQTDNAIELLRGIAKKRPGDPKPLIKLGDYLRSRESFSEAISYYDEAIQSIGKLGPDDWRLLYIRGIALEREGHWRRAEQDFLKALDFKPNQPHLLNYLGYSYLDKSINLDIALEMIRKAVKLRPKDGYIIDSLGWGYYRLKKFDAAVLELERAVLYRPEDPIINDHLGDAFWRVGRKNEARFQWRRSLSLNPKEDLIRKVTDKLKYGLSHE